MFSPAANSSLEEFELVRRQMEQFSVAFQSSVLAKKASISSSKQQHNNKLKELELKAQKLQAEISSSSAKRESTTELISNTVSELQSKKAKVEGLTVQLDALTESKDALQEEVKKLSNELAKAEKALVYARSNLDVQAQRDYEELTKFEMYMGLKVEAVEEDLLKFRFVNIDANDIDKEVFCELYVGEEVFKIGQTNPSLPAETLVNMEESLNKHGIIIVFLKQIRKALRDAL